MSDTSFLGFKGDYTDAAISCYPLGNGYRWDMTGLMRFNARDSHSPFGNGGINPYVYCMNDPINRIDPSGHVSFSSFLDVGLMFPGVGEGEIPELTSRVHVLDENNRVVPLRVDTSNVHEESVNLQVNESSSAENRVMKVWSVPDPRNFQHDIQIRRIRSLLGAAEDSINDATSISKSLYAKEQSLDDIHRMFLKHGNAGSLGSDVSSKIFGGGGSKEMLSELHNSFFAAENNMRDASKAIYYINKMLYGRGLDINSEDLQAFRVRSDALNNRLNALYNSFISFDELSGIYSRFEKGWFFSQETSV